MHDLAWHLAAPTVRLIFIEYDVSDDLISGLEYLHTSTTELRTLLFDPLGASKEKGSALGTTGIICPSELNNDRLSQVV